MQQFYQKQCSISIKNNAVFVVKYICDKNENASEITSEAFCMFLER